MKSSILFLLITLWYGASGQRNPDAIIGKWLKEPKKDLIIEVFKDGARYKGRIAWSKDGDPGKPLNYLILENLVYDSKKNTWKGGKIHDPNSGRSYNAEASINEDGSLKVLGYLGVKFLGTTRYFSRVN